MQKLSADILICTLVILVIGVIIYISTMYGKGKKYYSTGIIDYPVAVKTANGLTMVVKSGTSVKIVPDATDCPADWKLAGETINDPTEDGSMHDHVRVCIPKGAHLEMLGFNN